MTPSTPASSQTLAQEHRRALAAQANAGRSRRQQVRLRLLQAWGRRYRRPSPPAAPPHRILLIRPDHLGDLLFTTPALTMLRTAWPGAHLTALVGPWGEPVLAGHPALDDVQMCAFPGFTRQAKGDLLAPYRTLAAEASRLRAQRFDLAVILRFDHWWGAWLAAAAGIPQRVGYDIAEVEPFLTRRVPYVAGRHEVVQNLTLAWAAAGLPAQDVVSPAPWPLHFPVRAEDEAAAAALCPPDALAAPLVALHPGSGAGVKRWRAEAWAELAMRLSRDAGAQVVFTGSAVEAELIDPVLAALGPLPRRPVSLAGQTPLPVLAALYRRCALVIGPDSGPLHLAVAVGAPTVHLYGPVDVITFGPWGEPERHRVLTSTWACIPCNRLDWPAAVWAQHGCVRDMTVEQVWSAGLTFLAGS